MIRSRSLSCWPFVNRNPQVSLGRRPTASERAHGRRVATLWSHPMYRHVERPPRGPPTPPARRDGGSKHLRFQGQIDAGAASAPSRLWKSSAAFVTESLPVECQREQVQITLVLDCRERKSARKSVQTPPGL